MRHHLACHHGDFDFALLGKFNRIAGKVEQHLAQAQRVTAQISGGSRGHAENQLKPLVGGFCSHHRNGVVKQLL